ncbi:hypothetical protein SESBI_46822 [Sesbania bispinosa]|nr:hypothetical protein SESBI_46822 [Sesbania bispinosa]
MTILFSMSIPVRFSQILPSPIASQAAVEELKMFLQADTLQGLQNKLENLYVVMALRAMHPDFDLLRDQILTAQDVPTMENLITRLLRVPSPKTSDSHLNTTDGSAMMTTSGFRGGRANPGGRGSPGGRGGRGGNRPYCTYCKRPGHTQETCYSIHGFPEKTVNLTQSMPIQEDSSNSLITEC